MKTILLSPKSETGYSHLVPPIGLCALSANLKKYGHDCTVYDLSNYSDRKTKKMLLKENPTIIGISCITIERGASYKLAKLVRKLLPNCIIIFGGQHASLFPEQMFELAPIDYVVMFEGDETIVELVSAIKNNTELNNIKGIAYFDGIKYIATERRPLIKDLDTLPMPDYSNINFNDYISPAFNGSFIPIMSSRGCPYDCAFCSSTKYWSGKFRARSADSVVSEIKYYINKYGIKNFMFYDDNFIIQKDRLIDICKGIISIDAGIKFNIASSIRIIANDGIDRLYYLRKAGCTSIGFGTESCSNIVLKGIDKQQTTEEIKKAYMLVKKYGMKVGGSLIVGSPGETKETIKETASVLNEILPENLSYGGILWVLPGTTIYNDLKAKGKITDDIWLTTNKDIYYTAEHSLKELKHLQILLLYYQAKDRNLKQKLEFLKWYIYLNVPEPIKLTLRKIHYKVNYLLRHK